MNKPKTVYQKQKPQAESPDWFESYMAERSNKK